MHITQSEAHFIVCRRLGLTQAKYADLICTRSALWEQADVSLTEISINEHDMLMRRRLRLSREEVAKDLGLHCSAVTYHETGRATFPEITKRFKMEIDNAYFPRQVTVVC